MRRCIRLSRPTPPRWRGASPPATSRRVRPSPPAWTGSRRVDSALHAFVDLRADQALAEARAFDDAAARGAPALPLGGVPVTVKSALEVRGLRCETGSPSRLGVRAASDAVVVQRLRAAGAIVLGTTNVAEMLMGYETVNPLHGTTHNPWDLARTPGGSSGGESAAIAAGCSFAGIGSDGGGFDSRAGAFHRHLRAQADAGPRALHRSSATLPRPVLAHRRGRADGAVGDRPASRCSTCWPAGTPTIPPPCRPAPAPRSRPRARCGGSTVTTARPRRERRGRPSRRLSRRWPRRAMRCAISVPAPSIRRPHCGTSSSGTRARCC